MGLLIVGLGTAIGLAVLLAIAIDNDRLDPDPPAPEDLRRDLPPGWPPPRPPGATITGQTRTPP